MRRRECLVDGLLLAGVLTLQLLISLPRLNRPFVEGRAHWHYASAEFLLSAIHSQSEALPSRADFLGLKRLSYGPDGQASGFTHYARHPVLAPLLFNAYVRAAGCREWVPRSFALILSGLITVLLFLCLRRATEEGTLAALWTLLYIVLPLNFNYQDAWKYETLAEACLLLCVYALHRVREPLWRGVFLAGFFLLFQTDWCAFLPGLGLLAYAFYSRRREGWDGLWIRAAALAVVSAAGGFVLLSLLGFPLSAMRERFVYWTGAKIAGIPFGSWLGTQLGYLDMNFSALNAVLLVLLAAVSLRRREGGRHPLTAAGWSCLAGSLLWTACLRAHSHVHHYAQWFLGPAYLLLLGGLYAEARPLPRPELRRTAALALTVFALAAALHGSRRLETIIQGEDFAAPEDMAAIRVRTERLVAVSDGASGPREWWTSPNIALYTDPYYKARVLGIPRSSIRGGFAFAGELSSLSPNTDLVVALNMPGAVRRVRQTLRNRFGVRGLKPVAQSPEFVFLEPEFGAVSRPWEK